MQISSKVGIHKAGFYQLATEAETYVVATQGVAIQPGTGTG